MVSIIMYNVNKHKQMSKISSECSPINCLRYGTIIEQVLYVLSLTHNFLNFTFP